MTAQKSRLVATLFLFAACATPVRKQVPVSTADGQLPVQDPVDARPMPADQAAGPADAAPPAPDGPGPVPVDATAGAVDTSPPAPTPGALETIEVPASGAAAVFTTKLDQGQLFLLKATGAVDLGGQKLDAEYGADGMDTMGATDVGVDVGLLQIHAARGRTATPDGPGRMKWFPSYRVDHTYYMTVTGAGQALSLKLVKPAGAAGTGSVAVALFRLSPAPAIGEALDTLMVPVKKVTVMTKAPTDKTAVYLLQCAGSGTVGGGGLKLGDAEYMDWMANGMGKNEGEGGVDFGVGVDEPEVGRAAMGHDPRLRWWGPWRMDHTYYMLFSGSGNPISFTYHDTGSYGDNSATDALTVKVFAVP